MDSKKKPKVHIIPVLHELWDFPHHGLHTLLQASGDLCHLGMLDDGDA